MRFRMAGEDKIFQPPFFLPKKWRTKPQGFSSRGDSRSSHLHKKQEALLVPPQLQRRRRKSLHYIPLVKRSAALPVKQLADATIMQALSLPAFVQQQPLLFSCNTSASLGDTLSKISQVTIFAQCSHYILCPLNK